MFPIVRRFCMSSRVMLDQDGSVAWNWSDELPVIRLWYWARLMMSVGAADSVCTHSEARLPARWVVRCPHS